MQEAKTRVTKQRKLKYQDKARSAMPSAGATSYQSGLRAAVYGLWSGAYSIYDFIGDMNTVIRRGFTQAWYFGAYQCGVLPEDLTEEEKQRLEDEIVLEQGYVFGIATDIQNGQKGEALLRTHTVRIPMWVNRHANVTNIARSYACGDEKLKWVMNPIKEHCGDCLMLSGRVYRASIWRTTGWEPKSRDLACGGYKCGCDFEITSEPVTRGRPPRRI